MAGRDIVIEQETTNVDQSLFHLLVTSAESGPGTGIQQVESVLVLQIGKVTLPCAAFKEFDIPHRCPDKRILWKTLASHGLDDFVVPVPCRETND
jgi:hypothetical protein